MDPAPRPSPRPAPQSPALSHTTAYASPPNHVLYSCPGASDPRRPNGRGLLHGAGDAGSKSEARGRSTAEDSHTPGHGIAPAVAGQGQRRHDGKKAPTREPRA